jgi:uncharacterized membrane protein (DUF485 family)
LAYDTPPAAATTGSVPAVDWRAIEHSPEFEALVRAKMRFIIPATIFFLVYYFALPVLVGYAPDLMSTKIIGSINLAYLFALSQFAMTWIVMALYVQRAKQWDAQAAIINASVTGRAAR